MKIHNILSSLAVVFIMSNSANAVEKNITVTASIDPTLELAMSDGTPLPTAINMGYTPISGLQQYTMSTKIYSNDKSKDITMSLLTDPMLTNTVDSSKTIPLKVTYNQQAVTTTAWTADQQLKANKIFLDEDGTSVSMPLTISADNTGMKNWSAGTYQGIVSLLVKQVTPVTVTE